MCFGFGRVATGRDNLLSEPQRSGPPIDGDRKPPSVGVNAGGWIRREPRQSRRNGKTMSTTMIEELGKAQKAGEADARAKYRELLRRRQDPQPGDGVALAAVLNVLKLTDADFTADGRRLDDAAGYQNIRDAVAEIGRQSRGIAGQLEAVRPELLTIAADLLAGLDARRLLDVVSTLPTSAVDDKARAARERFAAVGAPLLDRLRRIDAGAAGAIRGADKATEDLSTLRRESPRAWIF
jgi:hypothetical protein